MPDFIEKCKGTVKLLLIFRTEPIKQLETETNKHKTPKLKELGGFIEQHRLLTL